MLRDRVLLRRPQVDSVRLPDESVLLVQKESGVALPINSTGAVIWDLCDGQHTLDQIVEQLSADYDSEPQQIGSDAQAFVAELLRLELLEPQPG